MGLMIAAGAGAGWWYAHTNPIVAIRETVSDTEIVYTDPVATPTSKTEKRAQSRVAVATAQALEQAATTTTPPQPFTFTVIADADSYKAPSGHNDELEPLLQKSASLKPTFGFFSGDLITYTNPKNLTVLKNLKSLIERHYTQYYIVYGNHDLECGAPCFQSWHDVFFKDDAKDVAEKLTTLPSPTPTATSPAAVAPQPQSADDQTIAALQIPTTEIASGIAKPVAPPIDAPPKPYHSFDHEQTHFILLSAGYPTKYGIDDVQMAWLANDLAATTARNIIVFSHVPPVSFFKESAKKCRDMTCDEPRQQKLVALFEKYGVDLVISGHEHVFDHKIVNGVDYVIAGNTGNDKRYKNTTWKDSFLFVTVEERRIIVTSLFADGTENRTFDIAT